MSSNSEHRSKPVFLDERQRRWWITRRALEISGVVLATVVAVFFVSITTKPALPSITLPETRPEFHALRPRPRLAPAAARRHGRLNRIQSLGKPIPAAYDPLRAAFYVSWDFTSLSSLKQHYRDLDVVMPERLQAVDPEGHMGISSDANLERWLRTLDIPIHMMPMVQNYDGANWHPKELAEFLAKPAARQRLVDELVGYVNAFPANP